MLAASSKDEELEPIEFPLYRLRDIDIVELDNVSTKLMRLVLEFLAKLLIVCFCRCLSQFWLVMLVFLV